MSKILDNRRLKLATYAGANFIKISLIYEFSDVCQWQPTGKLRLEMLVKVCYVTLRYFSVNPLISQLNHTLLTYFDNSKIS
jgi:hypothetical protein